MDLYRFLESFSTQQYGDNLVIPANALDRWAGAGAGVGHLQWAVPGGFWRAGGLCRLP
jgi:hypothetical protein